jgi:hypothetical protein
MSAIHDLIAQIADPRLRERLATEWANAAKNKKFGLVFEDQSTELKPTRDESCRFTGGSPRCRHTCCAQVLTLSSAF